MLNPGPTDEERDAFLNYINNPRNPNRHTVNFHWWVEQRRILQKGYEFLKQGGALTGLYTTPKKNLGRWENHTDYDVKFLKGVKISL